MASRNMPPGWGAASKTVTAYPLRRSCHAAVSPAGPEPTTATRLPFGAAGSTGTPRAGSCVSARKRLIRRIGSAPPRAWRVHCASHGA